ncbi:MAG: transcription-repair coupling factor, partial [Flavobacteriales bacterium]|nr:transcription-repair coupling factor [Flavobacteriales bacterium]
FIDNHKANYRNIIVTKNPKQTERMYNMFEEDEKSIVFSSMVLPLSEGFVDRELKIACYTEHQIFNKYNPFFLRAGFQKTKQAITLKELNTLQTGDYVTHIDHGVGQFSGLLKIDVNGKQQEAIKIIYKDGDILYVSIHSLHRVSKYSGQEGKTPKLHKIGSKAWAALKQKTKKRIKEIAFDIIKVYAKRKAEKGFAYAPDTYLQHELEASFVYEDTPDQITATVDVKKAMESEAPMDRLVCGDVGFGKTEIAIRAAFKAVTDSKQVAMMVPTTILTMQHFQTFSERLKDFPCNIEFINRFKSTKDQNEILERLEKGKIDIIIGTHRLAGKDIKFKDLGLLIVDEEQKFGVNTKDKLKTIKTSIDTLTLTATPIPRTLEFSMMGARDLSTLNTAPQNRQPIQTELHTFSERIVADAISYEMQRGGQVYFVNNRVQNIEEISAMINRLCPNVRIGVVHGQLKGPQIEKVMVDFIENEFDVLVATSIVESGLDIPNANTIIINNAHMFGLSDLHQLRGRVGRSNKKAFCYLLSPPLSGLTKEASTRLKTIEQFAELGSGFNIAMRDLDIRGAGDLLGGEQSGFINDLGFDTYQKILNEAIKELKENDFKDLYQRDEDYEYVSECQIETDLEILFPDDYINSVVERMALYKELNMIKKQEQLDKYIENLIDRFGPIPPQGNELFNTIRLRWIAKKLGLEKIILKRDKFIAYFVADQESAFFESPIFTKVLIHVQANAHKFTIKEKNDKLGLYVENVKSLQQGIELLEQIK